MPTSPIPRFQLSTISKRIHSRSAVSFPIRTAVTLVFLSWSSIQRLIASSPCLFIGGRDLPSGDRWHSDFSRRVYRPGAGGAAGGYLDGGYRAGRLCVYRAFAFPPSVGRRADSGADRGYRSADTYETVRLLHDSDSVPESQLIAVAGGEPIEVSPDVRVRAFPSLHSCIWAKMAGAPGEACLGDLGRRVSSRARSRCCDRGRSRCAITITGCRH